MAGLSPYTGEWKNAQIIHLLKRTMFGAAPDDVAHFQKLTPAQAVDSLLTAQPTPAPPVVQYAVNGYADPTGLQQGQTWVNAAYGDGTANSRRRASMKQWWLGQMVNQPRSIEEKMTVFWHNHFATETDMVDDARWFYRYHSTLRKFSLGNFKQFVKAVSIDPMMLIYLNGYRNVASAPDENYGRELQELFTLGKGPNSKYTEDDVKAAARALTGFRVDNTKLTYTFTASLHDTKDKQFSSFYGNKVIKARTGTDGEKELDDVLDMIFAQTEVALFISRKLYRQFVYYKISDQVEREVIAPMADVFRKSNYEIKPVLAALLTSEHFFDPLVRGCAIKTPLDLTVGICREFGVVFPAATEYDVLYNMWGTLQAQSATMQQDIGDPPNVAGWQAYYQEPQFYKLWINSDTLPKRNRFSDTLISTNGYTVNSRKLVVDVVAFAKKLAKPEDPNQLIQNALDLLYRIDVSADTKASLKRDFLLSGQASDYYWTDAWNAHLQNPTNAANKTIVVTRLTNLFKYITALPEYQLH